MKADLLQFGQGTDGTGREDHPRNEVIGQFGRQLFMRELVGVAAGLDQRCCLPPDGVVAGHEHDAAPHERGDGIVCGRKGAGRVFEVGGICGGRFLLFDQGIGLELPTRQVGEPVLVPHGLIVERKMRRSVGGRHRKEVGMLEGPDLCIERIAHQIEPRARDLGVVPGLLGRRLVGQDLGQGLMIPLLAISKDHRDRLEVATPRRPGEMFH